MSDPITKPDYYYYNGRAAQGPLDYAIEQGLGIAQHAVIKYITRAGRKPGNTALKDYKQAKFYLDWLIQKEEDSNKPYQIFSDFNGTNFDWWGKPKSHVHNFKFRLCECGLIED